MLHAVGVGGPNARESSPHDRQKFRGLRPQGTLLGGRRQVSPAQIAENQLMS